MRLKREESLWQKDKRILSFTALYPNGSLIKQEGESAEERREWKEGSHVSMPLLLKPSAWKVGPLESAQKKICWWWRARAYFGKWNSFSTRVIQGMRCIFVSSKPTVMWHWICVTEEGGVAVYFAYYWEGLSNWNTINTYQFKQIIRHWWLLYKHLMMCLKEGVLTQLCSSQVKG